MYKGRSGLVASLSGGGVNHTQGATREGLAPQGQAREAVGQTVVGRAAGAPPLTYASRRRWTAQYGIRDVRQLRV